MVKNVFYFMLKSSFRSWGIYIFSWPFDDAEKWLDKNAMVKVASRVQKIEVFGKGWNFAICFCFASCIMEKYYFFHRGKKRCFFPYFHYEVIFCYAELFECAFNFQDALLGRRQFLATESPLKMMENAFYFTSNTLFVLKIFKFLSGHFGHLSKRLDRKG